jgi:hypothetical protein
LQNGVVDVLKSAAGTGSGREVEDDAEGRHDT